MKKYYKIIEYGATDRSAFLTFFLIPGRIPSERIPGKTRKQTRFGNKFEIILPNFFHSSPLLVVFISSKLHIQVALSKRLANYGP